MASMSGPASTNMIKVQEMPAQEATLSITSTPASSLPAPSGGPGSHGATSTAENDATGGAQPLPQQELKDQESSHVAARDSTNYKVLVPPSPVVSPRMGPAAGNQNTFNFLNSDPTLQRSSSRRRMAPPIQVPPPPQPQQPHQQQQQQQQQPPSSVLPPQGGPMSPVSPGRRHPYHRWENVMPPNTSGEIAAHPGRELGQGQGQDQQEDGDYEDEGGNDDTDGDVFSGPEDQVDQRRRRYQHQRQKSSGAEGGVPFTPTRSAPQPPNFNGAAQPNSREAEIQHILYIQQQQALFLQEKAMNPPLRSKTSNGNLSGGGSDSSKPKRKGSRHRKQISVISEPRLLSSTNQIKTVPIVRPADQSDNEDAGTKSEYTSGGEGIKSTVRKMRKAVRHAASGVFNDDDSDREDALGSKSDVEKKGGLKQLKALKSKLAKKLHRPSHGGTSSSSRLDQNGSTENAEGENGRGPVQFFSEDNLRARYLAQEQQGGMSLAAAGASLRRSNTTRDNTGGSAVTFKTRDDSREGDKQEYNSVDENKDEDKENAEQKLSPQEQEERDAATKAKMAKFGSRTFDKDEMMEVKDGTGESFFVPRWDLDPRADELGSSKSVISVQSSKKLERSASSSTAASAKTTKLVMSIAERLQGTVVAEEEAEPSATGANASVEASLEPVKDEDFKQATAHSGDGPASDAADSKVTDKEESPVISKKLTEGVPAPEVLSPAFQAEQDAPHGTSSQDDLEQGAGKTGTASIASNSEPDSRASVLSEASNESSVGGLVVAHVLTRQSSMRKNFKRPIKGETKEGATEVVPEKIQQEAPTASAQSSHFGLGISMSTVSAEKQQTGLDEALGDKSAEKQLPPLPQEESKPLSIMTVRPLSPIRRGTAQSAKTSSIASASSILSSPSTPSANAPPSSTSMSPPDAHLNQESSVKNNVERKLSQTSIKSLRALSLSAFSLPQAPTSPLPSPSPTVNTVATIAPPTAPIPGVLTRQGSHLTERASIRSMYADSIYDCYDYDSADDYEGVNAAAHGSRQGSISSTRVPEEDAVFVVSLDATKEEQKEEEEKEVHAESASTGGTTVVEVASAMTVVSSAAQAPDSTVTVVSLSNISESDKGSSASSLSVEKETDLDARSAGMQETLPVIRLRGSSSKKNKDEEIMIMYKDEEHHVHYEDLPKAVPYRMSMMTTVPVDPVGVAASLSGPTLSDNSGLFPSRPPRHPMRQSRHGSIGTLSIGGSSDFTATDSWISSSVRNTRDDLSGWDVDGSVNGDNNNEREQHEQGGRRRSTSSNNSNNSSSHSISVAPLSTGVQQSIDSRSERTMSVMTDKSLIGLLDVVEEKEGDEVREIENPAAVDVAPVAKKQWYNQDRKRETWGSLQSSSSDSATTSSSSSRSSHFYFNGRSPSPSPTEEAAPASKAF
ncbi:hypothetical protein BGX28_008944 [Mortierella sp. GBA30]|nr:hypothetical protein BGX28_008944 [Mortierella sp. GBA30]